MYGTTKMHSVGMAFVALVLSCSDLKAQGSDGHGAALSVGQAEWRQNYDGATLLRESKQTSPILSQQTIAATEQAIAQYQDIVSRGGWPSVPRGSRLKLGSKGPAVAALRQRLSLTGDLKQDAGNPEIFDSYVEAAVRKFQLRHGLASTGFVGPQTLAALNVPAHIRLNQLQTNLVRLRSLSGFLGDRFVIVNIPGAEIETVNNGFVSSRHAAVVGKPDRQSPVMTAKITQVNFNPYWTVPTSIIRKDLIPKMQQEPDYLTKNNIRIFDAKGQEVQPSQINWNTMEAMNFRFRQDPGDLNSMGAIRINVPNPHGVYMHDTPAKNLFGTDFRFHSSGCVRVQNVRDFVGWLLSNSGDWNRQKIEQAIRSGQRIDADIKGGIPVYWVYVSGWGRSDGTVQFRDDIYDRDGLGSIASLANTE